MMRLLLLLFACMSVAVANTTPEPVVACIQNGTASPCGKHGECEGNACVCDPKFATLEASKPCVFKRTSKSLMFFLQMFFGFLGVSAFMLHWYWYGAAIYIVYLIACVSNGCKIKGISMEPSNDVLIVTGSLGTCSAMCTILGLWIATLVYIVSDCHSIEGNVSVACWDNL